MRAKDVMTAPVITVHPDTPLKEIANVLVKRQINAVPVVNEGNELVGIVSEADLVELETIPDPRSQVLPPGRRSKPFPRTAGDVMTTRVVALPEESDTSQIARLMLEKKIRQIPIVSGTLVTGIVAQRDLLNVLARSDTDIRGEVMAMLDDETLMLGRFGVEVTGGVVTLRGSTDRPDRRLVELLTRSVPGVLEVEFVEVNP
jgi:CBS domain-containing protein